jgi:hypothetical protein
LARRRGSARATVAVARSILVIIWHLLTDPDARYHDLGPGYLRQRTDRNGRTHAHVRQLPLPVGACRVNRWRTNPQSHPAMIRASGSSFSP